MAKRLVLFNHKAGTGKTTAVYNIGWMLSKNYNVLLVDADTQCDLSSIILGDNFNRYYLEDPTRHQNIKDGVSVAFSAQPFPIKAVDCVSPERAPTLYLLAGHANLSEYDAALTFAQTSNTRSITLQNLPGAFTELLTLTEEKYKIDYTIIDVSPSLSAINQNLFLISQGFIIPTNPTPFSIMVIDTLQNILPQWVNWKRSAIDIFADSAYPLPEGNPKFLGSLIQVFNIRHRIIEQNHYDNIKEIKDKISGDFFTTMSRHNMVFQSEHYPTDLIRSGYCLDLVPGLNSLIWQSYQAGVPIFELSDAEIEETGAALQNMQKIRDTLDQQLQKISTQLVQILSYE